MNTYKFYSSRLLLVGLLFIGMSIGAEAVIYVDRAATGANTGKSWEDAYTTVGAAIIAAVSGDNIWVAEGRYLEGSLTLKTGLGLYGGFVSGTSESDPVAHPAILDGSGHAHILTVNYSSYTVIDGFVITGGKALSGGTADKVGGGVRYANCNNTNVIRNCVITGNTAVYGGGIGLYVGSAQIANNIIMDNTAAYSGYGGGIYSKNSWYLLIEKNLIANNRLESTLYDGGGVYLEIVLEAEIRNNIIINNFCNRYGGGLALSDSRGYNVTVENNIISGNSTNNSAGGFYGGGCVGFFRRNIICGNKTNNGAGVQVGGDEFILENNLIAGNESQTWGGGIFFTGGSKSLFRNNVVAHNRGTLGGGLAVQAAGHPSIKHNIFSGNNYYDICVFYPQPSGNAIPTSIEYNDFWGNSEGVFQIEGSTEYPTVAEMDANLSVAHDNLALDPQFAGDLIEAVTWTADATYNPKTFQTTFYASGAGLIPGSLEGLFLNPDAMNQNLQFCIADNTVDTIVAWADANQLGASGRGAQIYNYRLQTPVEGAPSLSPLVDAGDPDDDPSSEPDYNGNRVNLGAYGGSNLAERTNSNPAISGFIVSNDGRPVPDVEVQLAGQGSVLTRMNGYYTKDVPPGYTGTVTPVKTQFTFEPASRDYSNVTDHQIDQGYAPVSYPPIIHVDVDAASGEQNGLNWQDAYLTLGEAIANTLAGQEIWVAEGTYTEGNLEMRGSNSLYGGFAGSESTRDERDPSSHPTIIDGQGGFTHILVLNSITEVTLDGFTIQGGNATDEEHEYTWGGGGILCLNCDDSVILSNNILILNEAIEGAGIYIEDASPKVRNNQFIENVAVGYGGGICCDTSFSKIENNRFSGNQAASGGGLYLEFYNGIASGNTIINNVSNNSSTYDHEGNGGGIFLDDSEAVIENNRIEGNKAEGKSQYWYDVGSGGGIFTDDSENTIRNNEIVGNQTNSYACDEDCGNGGGIYSADESIIENNRILGNVARNGQGGGAFLYRHPILRNNIIVGNHATSELQSYNDYYEGMDGLGGGVYGYRCTNSIKGNLIADNLADEEGGGVLLDEGTLEQNSIVGNYSEWWGGGGFLIQTCVLKNNLILGNSAAEGGGGLDLGSGQHEIANNVFAANIVDTSGGGGICLDPESQATIKNNIFSGNNQYDLYEWDSDSDPVEIGYNNFFGNTDGIYFDEGSTAYTTLADLHSQVPEAVGNIDEDPLFVGDSLAAGQWTSDAVYSITDFQTTLTDASAEFTANALAGRFLNPSSATGTRQFAIIGNTATTITVWGDASSLASNGDPYRIFDYHLQCVADGYPQNSPCIDAGDPNSDYSQEPYDNGGRINQGCYGNTSEAARTSSSMDPADVNRDGFINSLDLFFFSLSWQIQNATPDNPCNPDQDTDVDENDLLYFIPEWK